MDLSTSVLGAGVVGHLLQRQTAAVARFGRDHVTRADLAKYHCYNFQAAVTLSATINREFDIRDTKDLFEHVSPAALALPRIGSIAIAVLGAVFQMKHLGGPHPLEAWVRHHASAPDAKVHTFTSMKIRDAKERAAERQEKRRRQRTRRAAAHSLRRDRFLARSGATA